MSREAAPRLLHHYLYLWSAYLIYTIICIRDMNDVMIADQAKRRDSACHIIYSRLTITFSIASKTASIVEGGWRQQPHIGQTEKPKPN